MSLMKEFKAFALKGNVIDMAVGIVIGVAFGKIVSSLVADIIMPPIGVLLGGVDFSNLVLVVKHAIGSTPAVTINYGKFFNTIIEFLIIAFSIFLVVKGINATKKKEETATKAPAAPPKQEVLLEEIRDLLKQSR